MKTSKLIVLLIIQAIASGSNGNCFLIHTSDSTILIDHGISFKKLKKSLDKLGISPSDISHVLITHAHSDHVSGLPVLYSKIGMRIVGTEGTLFEIQGLSWKDERYHTIARDGITISNYDPIIIGDFQITSFPTHHDIQGAVGFHIQHLPSDIEISYATDTADIVPEFKDMMSRSELIFLESNHDVGLLKRSSRPPDLKQRIRRTHLNNIGTISILNEVISECTRVVLLGHLSGECNTVDIVLSRIASLKSRCQYDFDWIVCSREAPGTIIEIEGNGIYQLKGGLSNKTTNPLLINDLASFF